MTPPPAIKRAFADLAHGQMHYRTAGSGAPLLLIHASPGSSKQLSGLIADLAGARRVIAPDTPGNGDSPALPVAVPQIADLARAYLGLLDALGLDRIAVYGSHTGAAIAAELAILAPDRVERVVLDGVQSLTAEERAEVMSRYAHPFTPDLDGAWLMRAFTFCRDQYLFYPWYDRSRAGQRTGGLPTPQVLSDWVIEVLKAGETYQLNYHAAFRWEAAERLPFVTCPALMMAAKNDPLFGDTAEVTDALREGAFMPLPRLDAPDYRAVRQAAILAFLASATPD